MKRSAAVVALILVLITGVAAGKGPQPGDMLVQTGWLAAHLHDKDIVMLHVGVDRKTYDQGHIPGARFLALSDLAITRNGIPNELPEVAQLKSAFERAGVGDKSRVILYGDELGLFAARAYFTLDYLGKTAALLDGGLEKWKSENREVSATAPAPPAAVTFTPRPNPELLADLAAVQTAVKGRKLVIIDARPPAEYAGTTPGGGVKRAGHIPGAKNVFWVDNLVSRQNPILKPVTDIRTTYQAAGVTPANKVIVYCRSGVQAAHDYFTLKLTGFQPILYDGSFIEWNQQANTAVENTAGK